MIKEYLQLTKPRIILGNLVSVTGGFLLASKGHVNYSRLFITLISMALIIASSCVFNNIIDCDIDKKMYRTRNRVLVKEKISLKTSMLYGFILGIMGFWLIYSKINLLTIWLTLIGFLIYVFIYSLYMKRHSIYGTLVGSLAGAVPPVTGYCAVTNHFDVASLILLIIFTTWQIPHAYAIAIYRFKDYQRINIPILPLIKGIKVAKNHIIVYILLFIIANLLLTITGFTGYKYLLVTCIISFIWLIMSYTGYKTKNNSLWARRIFLFSIINITVVSIMMSIDHHN
ncbi:heme o synthase [Candidatus Ishikawella capsulata]|uniref:Protoheme IX farnesyltransferase n=1 Tax=Candidatus Ishikawaella capsulata Mpkobe TaxID=476281 RepID=C5WCZ8_9ENTR|nr:heme o synthase [Candidatus Ishikawaella capsulata]BAH83204.1 protoheme IX farnesyltransferase [Candidatus Ishikawaella capsulata Mpkobe]